jgi:hypothetical protein
VGVDAGHRGHDDLGSPRTHDAALGDEMKRKWFTEEQIIGMLKRAEQAGNIRELERENTELKKRVAELSLDVHCSRMDRVLNN